MLYNLSATMKARDGRDIKHDGAGFTVSTAVINALDGLVTPAEPERLSGADKAKRFILATKIAASPHAIDLTIEDAALCKKVVGDAYAPLVVGQVFEAFEAKKPTAVDLDVSA